MYFLPKTPRPARVTASPRAAAFSAVAGATSNQETAHTVASVNATAFAPVQSQGAPPAVPAITPDPSGGSEADEALHAAYAEFVRSGAAAAAACVEPLLARDREAGLSTMANAACSLSEALLRQASLPSIGTGGADAGGAEGAGWASAGMGAPSSTPLLVSMLLDEKAKRHRTLEMMLRAALPPEAHRLPLDPAPAGGGAGGGEEGAPAARAHTLASVLSANSARLACARVLRAEHNALASAAPPPPPAGAPRSAAGPDAGAALALDELESAMARCAGGGQRAAAGAGAGFYRRVDTVEAVLPELATAVAAVAARGASDGSERAAAIARALDRLLHVACALVTEAERSAAGSGAGGAADAAGAARGEGGLTERVAAGAPCAAWLGTPAVRAALLACARLSVAWAHSDDALSAARADAAPLALLSSAHALACALLRGHVGEAAAAWLDASGRSAQLASAAPSAAGGPSADDARAAASPAVRRALDALAAARREAATAFLKPQLDAAAAATAAGATTSVLSRSAVARAAAELACDLGAEFHDFELLAELCSRPELGLSAPEERLAAFLERFHPTRGRGALWAWERVGRGGAAARDGADDASDASAALGTGFPRALMQHYMACGAAGLPRLMGLGDAYDDDVAHFLAAHPQLLWLHHIKRGARAAERARAGARSPTGPADAAAPLFSPATPFAAPAPGARAARAECAPGALALGEFGAAAETLYQCAAAEGGRLSIKSLFLHLGKLAHLASSADDPEDTADADADGSLPLGRRAPSNGAAPRPEPAPVTVALPPPAEPNAAGACAPPARTPWPLQRADDEIYAVHAQRVLDGVGMDADVPCLPAASMVAALLGGAGAEARARGGGEEGGGGGRAFTQSDLFLALDLWERSRWDEEDAAARDAAVRVGPGGLRAPPPAAAESELELVRTRRAKLLSEIWAEAIRADMDSAWRPLCDPATRWGGDEQLSSVAQSTLVFHAVVYQRAHGRMHTLAAIEAAVSQHLQLLPPAAEAEVVRAALAERVQQVVALALEHRPEEQEPRAAASAEQMPAMMLTT